MGEWDVFDKYSESTCTCHCGHVFRSHARTAMTGATGDGAWELRSRKPCPGCGRSNSLRSIASDPEVMTVAGTQSSSHSGEKP